MIALPPAFLDAALLLMRLMIAAIFITSGWSHIKDPAGRGQSIGMGKGFTLFLGLAELAGGLGVAAGVLAQFAAAGLILACWERSKKRYLFGRLASGASTEMAGATT